MALACCIAAITANAQEEGGFYGNKFFDNCYIGVNAGMGAGTTHNRIFHNVNWNAGLRLGKFFSPIFGFGIEGNCFSTTVTGLIPTLRVVTTSLAALRCTTLKWDSTDR